jgi:hypothetical protein
MIKPAHIDPNIPTRSVDFAEALQVLEFAADQPHTYTELMNASLNGGLIVGRGGERLKKSSFHRTWKTLEVLNLIRKEKQYHIPTPAGQAVLLTYQHEGQTLSEKVKKLLREQMLNSELARRSFFDLFATKTSQDPLEDTAALALIPNARKNDDNHNRSEGSARSYKIRNIVTGFAYDLTNRQVQGVIWGLGSWAMKLDLADQLYARPQDGIESSLSKIVFLTNPDRDASSVSDRFTQEVENLIFKATPVYGTTVRLPISWLFYHICPSTQIGTVTVRKELTLWLAKNKNRAFVEGASAAVVKSIRQANRSGQRISWSRQEPALLEMNGRYFTSLFCQK